MTKHLLLLVALGGCDLLGARVSDVATDAPPQVDVAVPDASGPRFVLPAGTTVPSIVEVPELVSQIKIFDGLSDNALAASSGVITRSTGKAGGVSVRFWNFGSAPIVDGIISSAPLYVLADDDGSGNLTPRTDHPWLIDSIPGDPRYSAIRRVIYVPVMPSYAGEVLTSIDALSEALALGIVGEPRPAGTWSNMPVVPPGTQLEVGTSVAPLATTEVYGRGYRLGLFQLGLVQPFRNNQIPMGHESRLLSGVATGVPPVLTTQLDAAPVFQFGIPATPPGATFNYTPIVTELDVRLAAGVEPTAIGDDGQLFRRSSSGAITGQYADCVAGFVVTAIYSNKQIQFADGAP